MPQPAALTLAQVRELSGLVSRIVRRERAAGDERHPIDIADAMLEELGAPDLAPVLQILRQRLKVVVKAPTSRRQKV